MVISGSGSPLSSSSSSWRYTRGEQLIDLPLVACSCFEQLLELMLSLSERGSAMRRGRGQLPHGLGEAATGRRVSGPCLRLRENIAQRYARQQTRKPRSPTTRSCRDGLGTTRATTHGNPYVNIDIATALSTRRTSVD